MSVGGFELMIHRSTAQYSNHQTNCEAYFSILIIEIEGTLYLPHSSYTQLMKRPVNLFLKKIVTVFQAKDFTNVQNEILKKLIKMILLSRFFASKIKRILMYFFNFSFPERLVRYLSYNVLCRTFLTDLPEIVKVLKINLFLFRA